MGPVNFIDDNFVFTEVSIKQKIYPLYIETGKEHCKHYCANSQTQFQCLVYILYLITIIVIFFTQL